MRKRRQPSVVMTKSQMTVQEERQYQMALNAFLRDVVRREIESRRKTSETPTSKGGEIRQLGTEER